MSEAPRLVAGKGAEPVFWAAVGFSLLAAGFLAAMGVALAADSLPALRHAGWGLLTGGRWFYRAGEFGALSMLYGTAVVAAIALLVAAPLGVGAAVFTAEILPGRWRLPVKAAIELLAGVPSVVYGLLGVLVLRPWIFALLAPFEPLSGDTLATAGLLLAVMVLPTVATLSDDALAAVPARLRQAARGLGLNRAETIFRVSLPQALPGVAAALLLALGRALGETIAVFLVVGRQDNQLPERLLSASSLAGAGQTLTTKLGGSETHIAYGDPLHWGAMMGLALLLMLLVVGVTAAGAWLAQRGRRVHA